MTTSSNRNISRVIVTLWGESTGQRWISFTNANESELWYFFICARTNGWTNNRSADNLRRHHAHYYVNVMITNTRKRKSNLWFLHCTVRHVWHIVSLLITWQGIGHKRNIPHYLVLNYSIVGLNSGSLVFIIIHLHACVPEMFVRKYLCAFVYGPLGNLYLHTGLLVGWVA